MRDEHEKDDQADEPDVDTGEQHSNYGEDDDHIYVDRDKIDFDPEDGLLAGTAVDGTSDIPGSPSNPEDDDDESGEDDQSGKDDG